jgi:limonene-1,2-epoxide hydrolase
MHEHWERPLTAIELLEIELVVRDFVTILNEGSDHDIHAFLTEDVTYQPSAREIVRGRGAVVSMIRDIRGTFTDWHTELVSLAVSGQVVLAELAMCLTLPATGPQWVMGFASFRVDNFRISAWHQVHA